MNLQHIKQKLEKVNRFHTYLVENEDIISKIDRDSLLDYIRELYDACFDDAVAEVTVPTVVEKIVEKIIEVPVEKVTTPKVENKRPTLVFNSTVETTENSSTEAIITEKPAEKVIETIAVKEETIIVPTKEVEKAVEVVVEKTVVKEEIISETKSTNSSDGFNEDYEELFMFKTATDLSQKLSESPLSDLNKALGLNEKFLFINELFAGDVSKFQTAIKLFNEGKNFDSVRNYMESDLIEQFKWMDKVKKTVAKDFVKLVRRRYL